MAKWYKTKSGAEQWMPSIEEAQECNLNGEGWCLACGETMPAEPDARKYKCESCSAHKVYGAQELALMGLVY